MQKLLRKIIYFESYFELIKKGIFFCSVQLKGFVVPQMFEMMDILYENYDTFKAYSVDKYMSSLGLSVDQRYRGRGIGDHFLTSRLVSQHLHFFQQLKYFNVSHSSGKQCVENLTYI